MKSLAVIVLSGFISIGVFSQTPKPKTASTKSNSSTSNERPETGSPRVPDPARTPDDKAGWEKVLAVENPGNKAVAVKEFLAAFPDSVLKTQAQDLLVRSEAEEGYLRLQTGDLESAGGRFIAASTGASKPVNEQLFNEVLSKLPANLFFRGAREDGLRVAAIIEEKIESNHEQILALANFYLGVENGSKARQLAELAIKLKPESAAAYQTLGLAHRMDFQFEDSAAAYEKALVLEPESNIARRGLAEMKRSLGKADDAVLLYREILAKDGNDLPSRSGLVLSLFETGKRSDAEAELAASLAANPGNVILLAGVAYWYAAQGKGEKAVEFAKKAIDVDPRFIWSHIALGRGYMVLKKPFDAEKTLLAARRYGNFPTLDYEIASSRLAAGFFRDAEEELAKSFTISQGLVQTRLGGRINRASQHFADLVGSERRASIFTPLASETSQNDAKLFALLELKQALDSPKPDTDTVLRAVDQFIQGDDGMKLHRRLFAAGLLLDKKIELARAVEIAQAAIANVDSGLEAPNATSAILASELYESRAIAVARGEYLNVPDIPRSTLSAIVRGRIEEIIGWAKYQMDDHEGAVVRLKRAVSVLPGNSAWWQSASWRLGSALVLSGKDNEALETFVRTYKGSKQPDRFRYDTIAALYRKIHGNIDDLEALIGPNPAPPMNVAVGTKPTDKIEADSKEAQEDVLTLKPAALPVLVTTAAATPEVDATPTPTPEVPGKEQTPLAPHPLPEPTKEPDSGKHSPAETKDVINTKVAAKNPEIFPPVIITIPSSETRKPAISNAIPFLPNPVPKSPPISPERRSNGHAVDSADTSPSNLQSRTDPPGDGTGNTSHPGVTSGSPDGISPCSITSSDESLTLSSESGGKAVIVSLDDETDLDGLKALSSSPENVSVRREPIVGINSRALYVIRSANGKSGVYQVTFELPCGKKVIVVRVR